MGRLHTLAAGTALLALGVKAEVTYLGCAALDTSTIQKTTELFPQGPVPCLSYCNSIGFSYAGMQAQFCSCWDIPPVATTKYVDSDHADCSFNCDEPYNAQYCGGIDLSTLGFIYNYYAGVAPPVIGGPSSSNVPGEFPTSSGGVILPPPATSSAGVGGATPPGSSSAGGFTPSSELGGGVPILPSTSAGEVLPPTSSGDLPPPGPSGPSGVLPPASSGPSGGGVVPPPSSLPSGVVVPTPSRSARGASGSASPSSIGVGGAPIATIVVLTPGQPFVISIAPYLRSVGDRALSWIPSPPWFLYSIETTSFFGTIPLDFPLGPLVITITAGQPTTGSNGPVGRRQAPAAIYTFAIELLIVGPGVSVPPLPSGPVPTPTLTSRPAGGPVIPPSSPGAVLPSYTNTVYQTITTTITRCPVCAPEVTLYAVPIGTTCITAEVFTTPCEVTVTRTRADGVVTPAVVTTTSTIPYNPAESTVVVTTIVDLATKYTTTLLIAVTRTIQRLAPTDEAVAVQPLPPPPPGVPGAGPVALPPPKGAFGTGAANNGSQPYPTMPVTAGASMDRVVEMFVLLCGIAFGALLLL